MRETETETETETESARVPPFLLTRCGMNRGPVHVCRLGSGNHIMLGGFDPFLHTHVGGLDSVVNGTSAGWEHVRVRVAAAAVTTLRHTSHQRETRFGTISLHWSYTEVEAAAVRGAPALCDPCAVAQTDR